jgi:hypothetical protein
VDRRPRTPWDPGRYLAAENASFNESAAARYPAYENGACFMLHTGLELAARGATGDPDAAFDRFMLAMSKFNATQLWSQNIRWDHGTPKVPEVTGGDVSQVRALRLCPS